MGHGPGQRFPGHPGNPSNDWIGGDPRRAPNHSAEFATQADTDEAYRAMLDGGVAPAWTALDAATDPTLRAYLLKAK